MSALLTVSAIPASMMFADTKPTLISGVPVSVLAVDATAVSVPLNSPSLKVEMPDSITVFAKILASLSLPGSGVIDPINPPRAVTTPLSC